jgi:hypothetical protein
LLCPKALLQKVREGRRGGAKKSLIKRGKEIEGEKDRVGERETKVMK